jgi:FtsH-binding integral membrane protein
MSKRKTRKTQSRPQHTSKSQPYTKSVTPPKKVRGGWLTGALIFIAVHALITAALLVVFKKQAAPIPMPWLWTAAVLVALAEIGGAVGMWFWKRWGLYLFIGAILAGIVVGFFVFPSLFTAFHGIIPVLILGYILQRQNKLQLME